MSIVIFSAAPLIATPAKKLRPPNTMMFLWPKAAVKRLATREAASPAIQSEDVKDVRIWLSYAQYTFVSAPAAFFSIEGKNFSRKGLVVTPPIM